MTAAASAMAVASRRAVPVMRMAHGVIAATLAVVTTVIVTAIAIMAGTGIVGATRAAATATVVRNAAPSALPPHLAAKCSQETRPCNATSPQRVRWHRASRYSRARRMVSAPSVASRGVVGAADDAAAGVAAAVYAILARRVHPGKPS